MKFGVMGTGQVGRTVGEKLQSLGHDVMLGSRDPAQKQDLALKVGTITEAAQHGEWIVNALPGEKAIGLLGGCILNGKIFIDIANYDLAVDQPIPTPVGEAIQSAFPSVRLVKALNSVSAHLMVDPAALKKPHSVFIASNDTAAKAEVGKLLESFGWEDIVDLGDLTACRAMEQLIPMWMRLEEKLGGPNFNLAVVRS
jgi:8-hydroxy-5-deazaflavin:NADPH oxidoreductase